jgi:hypothetical protein
MMATWKKERGPEGVPDGEEAKDMKPSRGIAKEAIGPEEMSPDTLIPCKQCGKPFKVAENINTPDWPVCPEHRGVDRSL